MNHVFTYGSLMFPEVWQRVTASRTTGEPARLDGFEARKLAGQTYPVLVTAPSSAVEGMLYRNVDAGALARLDLFEGDFYARRTVTVIPGGGGRASGEKVPAEVYAAAAEDHPDILPERWLTDEFRDRHLTHFLTFDRGFAGPR
ncbi:MAG: hypothetical protein JWM59_1089 [Verrucomicrobiales bacterium]|nr:hypothetical protein [Verrucomicrobiales bacterium]